jgi:hypothetical protein
LVENLIINEVDVLTSGNFFENSYLGSVTIDGKARVPLKFPLEFWNHYDRILKDPELPQFTHITYKSDGMNRVQRYTTKRYHKASLLAFEKLKETKH